MRVARKAGLTLVALVALAPAAAGRAQVLVRGADGGLACVTGGPDTHPGAACSDIACMLPRVCLELPGLGARCVDRANELVCLPTTIGCDVCPLISTGADPEGCRVIDLASGTYALCIYGVELVCLAGSPLDVAACVPPAVGVAGIGLGDCDADGVTNAMDRCLCESAPGSADGCPLDGAVVSVDAGNADAGSFDAGAVDAGPKDAGPVDAARPAFDAAGSTDAAQPSATVTFRGGSGCVCSAGSAGPPRVQTLALALAALAWLAAARRRRRRESRTRRQSGAPTIR